MIINTFIDELQKTTHKEIIKNIPLKSLKIFFNPDKKILADRELRIQERPSLLMQTERYFSERVLDLFLNGKVELHNVAEIEFPLKTRQLGEKAQIYGKIMNRIEGIIHEGNYQFTTESIVINKSWRKFTSGFSPSERRDLIKYRDYFTRILFYINKGDKIIVQEKVFLMINFSYKTTDGRLLHLQNTDHVENISSIENIEFRLNREVFDCLHKYLIQKNSDIKGAIGGGGVRKSIAGLPDIISQRFNFYKPFIINQAEIDPIYRRDIFANESIEKIKKILISFRYNDRMRIAFERIIDVLFTGMEKRKSQCINFDEEIYDLLYISKHSGDKIRFAYVITIFNLILNDIEEIPPLFLVIEKHGKNFKKLHAEINLKRL